jgi:Domain of unknown function (DUF397)
MAPPPEADFRKSSYSSDQQACVEVAGANGGRWVRDSKYRTHPALHYPAAAWDAFLHAVKADELDR